MAGIADILLKRMFGLPQGFLGRLGGIVKARMKEEVGDWLIELLDVRPEDRILEVGFGPGVVVHRLAAAAPGVRVSGVDPSSVMLEQARRRNASHMRSDRVDLRLGTAARLPFEDGSRDKAVSLNSMQMWPDPVAGLREIRRVLVPGGPLVLGFTPHAGQGKDAALAALESAGFAKPRLIERKIAFCVVARASGPSTLRRTSSAKTG